jgi:arginyl-tRNA synthetase
VKKEEVKKEDQKKGGKKGGKKEEQKGDAKKKVEKMKTREGKTVKLMSLLDEAKERAMKTFEQRLGIQDHHDEENKDGEH